MSLYYQVLRYVKSRTGAGLSDGDLLYVNNNEIQRVAIGAAGYVLTARPGNPAKIGWEASAGGTGGGGTTDHAALSNLSILASGHTSTANRIWGSGAAGGASLYAIGVSLQGWSAELDAVAALTQTGIAVRTGTGPGWAVRSIDGPAAGITISNPSGVAGNFTFALANDLAALEALSGTGYAHRTGTNTWTLDTAAEVMDDILTAKGDILARDTAPNRLPVGTTAATTTLASGFVQVTGPQFLAADSAQAIGLRWTDGYTRFTITSTGQKTVILPSLADCTRVVITLQGSGTTGAAGGVGAGTVAGGRGGSSGARTVAEFARSTLPATISIYVGAATSGAAAAIHTYAETTPVYAGGAAFANAAQVLSYAEGGSGGNGGGTTVVQLALLLRSALNFKTLAGVNGTSGPGGASGTPTALVMPGNTSAGPASCGCGGAGKTAGAAAAGGGWSATGSPLGALAGGASGGGNGGNGSYGGGAAGGWTTPSTDVAEWLWAYGGRGGGSIVSGTGGAGGIGAPGCGGGGGGAGTVAGGAGGAGGDGYAIVECYA